MLLYALALHLLPFKPQLEENAATQTSFPVRIRTVNIARHPTLPNPPVCWLLIVTASDINNKHKFRLVSCTVLKFLAWSSHRIQYFMITYRTCNKNLQFYLFCLLTSVFNLENVYWKYCCNIYFKIQSFKNTNLSCVYFYKSIIFIHIMFYHTAQAIHPPEKMRSIAYPPLLRQVCLLTN